MLFSYAQHIVEGIPSALQGSREAPPYPDFDNTGTSQQSGPWHRPPDEATRMTHLQEVQTRTLPRKEGGGTEFAVIPQEGGTEVV